MRPLIVFSIIFLLGAVSVAGWLGFRSNDAETAATSTPPSTVEVTTCDVEQSVTAPGNLVNTRQATVEMPNAGRLAEVLVKPGDRVEAGQVLATVDEREETQAEVSAAELELLEARKALQDLHAQAPSKRAEAQVALAEAEDALEDAQRNRQKMDNPHSTDELVIEKAETDYLLAKQVYKEALQEYNKWAKKKLTTPERVEALNRLVAARQDMDRKFAIYNWYLLDYTENDIAQADADLALAQARLEAARATWELLEDGPDALEVASAEARVAEAETRLAAAQDALSDLELRAPFAGVVLEVNSTAGNTLAAGSPVIVLQDPHALEIEATVVEEDLPSVQTGQPVMVYFDAFPEAEVKGQVSRIVPKRAEGDRPLYYVYIALEELPDGIVAGMTADSSIAIDQSLGALCLPRTVVRAAADDTANVLVWAGNHAEQRTIQVGLRGDAYVEILSGLKAGERVVAK